jgi:hypothetical protein
MVVPPVMGFVRLCITFGYVGGKAGTDAGVDVMFPQEFCARKADPESKLAQLLNKPMAKQSTDEASKSGSKEILSPAAHFFEKEKASGGEYEWTNHEALAWAMILRGRKYVERPWREMDLTGVLKQVGAISTHYISHSRLDHLRKCGIPCLVVAGALDNLVNATNSKFLSKALSARLFYREDAGHGLAEQYEEEVNLAIEEMVAAGEKAKETKTEMIKEAAVPAPPGPHPWPCYMAAILLAALAGCDDLRITTALLLVVLVAVRCSLE